MATMFDALSDGSLDLQNKRDLSSDFSRKLVQYRDSIVSEHLKFNIDLSSAISKIAKKDNLNDDQIHRIVEEVNNQVYLAKYSQLKGSNERDVNFDLASVQKVKELCGSKSESSKDDTAKNESSDKGEKIEKKASEEFNMTIFNGPAYTYGNLAPNMKISKEEFITNKIASKITEQQNSMEKIARNIKVSILDVADALISLDRNGADSSDVLSKMARALSFEDAEIGMIKEACGRRIESLKEDRQVNPNYSLELEVSMDKTASEKFSLGKYSLSKQASEKLPAILTINNTQVKGMDDMLKMASHIKENISKLKTERDGYVNALDKCAKAGLNIEEFEKQAGAANNFFQMC
ncbi:MAG: hypothetical protein ACRCX2_23170 [Paraclostridium sp.]